MLKVAVEPPVAPAAEFTAMVTTPKDAVEVVPVFPRAIVDVRRPTVSVPLRLLMLSVATLKVPVSKLKVATPGPEPVLPEERMAMFRVDRFTVELWPVRR